MLPAKVLITGISGIVGSSAYLRLCAYPDRYQLYGFGRRRDLSARVTDNRRIDLPAERHWVGDLADFAAVRRAVDGMDAVIHLAADPGSGDWDSLLKSNLIGAYNMFEACRQAGVRRLVAASTIQVSAGQHGREPYNAVGRGRIGAVPPEIPRVGDTMPAEPRNLYASTKVFSESLCRTYAHTHGMSCLAVRIGWVVAEDRPLHRRAVDIWCSQRDVGDLLRACIDAPEDLRFGIFYAMSNNVSCWVDMESARHLLGFVPQDRAEDWLDRLPE
jgi:nucleoside-diphosphate-sugar epimerase